MAKKNVIIKTTRIIIKGRNPIIIRKGGNTMGAYAALLCGSPKTRPNKHCVQKKKQPVKSKQESQTAEQKQRSCP